MQTREAIVAGAGPAGLAAAAALKRKGVDVLVLERTDRIADRWRHRYEGLRLNTMRVFSSLPGQLMPRRYGRYPMREDFLAYLEDYADRQRLEIAFDTELERVERDDGSWRLETSSGSLGCRYAVIATGFDAVPKIPEWPGRDTYTGDLIHAAAFRRAGDYRGRDVLVVGAGNTGIDIAGLLVRAGANVTVGMRTPPNIFPRQAFGVLPLQPSAILLDRLPSRVGDVAGRITQRMNFGDLSAYGIPAAPQGVMTTLRDRLVAAAVDDGFIAALKEGKARVVPTVQRLEGAEVVLADGSRLQPDTVICATGYRRGLEPLVGHLGVLDRDGIPTHLDAAPENPSAPRLYFAGFYGTNAGQIRQMPFHARRIARAVARDRRSAGGGTRTPMACATGT